MARRSVPPRDMGAKPPKKAKKPKKLIAHELRAVDGGTLLLAVSLPAGEPLKWDPPVVAPKSPGGVGEVELYLDGVLSFRGTWPNLKPV